jgi:hypothetical protein
MLNAQEMFQHEVGDIYDAEHRFLTGQQEMLTNATDPQLQGLIRQHMAQTQQHIKNLDQVFTLLGQQPKGVMCDSPRQRDVYVPFDAIQETTGTRIRLNLPAGSTIWTGRSPHSSERRRSRRASA